MKFPVLGRWKNEGEFRDHLAAHLDTLEPDLVLIETEHTLRNPNGAGGRVDILATDALGNFVCIEVKRSDNSARATLNELAKYLVLFCQENDVTKERVRCILVSTHWHEARLPLSTFAMMSGADVSGYEAKLEDGKLSLDRQEMQTITFSPQISPEICVMYFADEQKRQSYLLRVKQRAAQLPFLRVAVLQLDPKPESKFVDHVAVTYLWKIPSEFHSELETVIGNSVGWLFPYAYEGSEAEADASYWAFLEDDDLATSYFASSQRGTSEKVTSLLQRFSFKSIERVGRWPAKDVVNTDEKLLSQMTSFSSMTGGAQQHDYHYAAIARPQLEKGFQREVSGFLEFLSFSPVFKAAAETYLTSLHVAQGEVTFEANRGRNAFMDLYLSHRGEGSQLASFQIIHVIDGVPSEGLAGGYYWDGDTRPQDPESNISAAYGNISLALMQAFSTTEWHADTDVLAMHGLIPAVFQITLDGPKLIARSGAIDAPLLSFQDFERVNRTYVEDLVRLINSASNLGSVNFSADGR